MNASNFNWLIHVMLLYHTRNVIKQQTNKARKREAMDIDKDGDSDDMAD